MGVVYANFKGFLNLNTGLKKLNWTNLKDECGEDIAGEFQSYMSEAFKTITLKFGNRYMIECERVVSGNIVGVQEVKLSNKNLRCDIFRFADDEYHIIKGKYKGKKHTDLSYDELFNYLIWLGKNTRNEATKLNVLKILKFIKK